MDDKGRYEPHRAVRWTLARDARAVTRKACARAPSTWIQSTAAIEVHASAAAVPVPDDHVEDPVTLEVLYGEVVRLVQRRVL
jgi:hypothetical protein